MNKLNAKKFVTFKYSNQLTGVPIWRINKNLIFNPNEVLVHDTFRVVIDFPLKFPKLYIFEPRSQDEDYSENIEFDIISSLPRPNNFTRLEILNLISRTYKNIYKEEKNTATLSIASNIPGGISGGAKNKRPETNGIHSIYDYEITQLNINGMLYCPNQDYWKLFMQSN